MSCSVLICSINPKRPLDMAEKREPITAIQALAHIRCMRLAARIDELRHEGYAIHTEMITVGSGKQVARYVLVA